MAETTQWAFPENLQPNPKDLDFDFESALASVVMIRSEIPEDAFTASILGTERVGNGVVIREDGLILTIGYLVTEAETVWLTTNQGIAIQGHPLAYDFATGFGLVQALGRLKVPAIPRGSATKCNTGSNVVIVGHGGREHALKAKVIAKREFAGYWEYLLDEAIFTAPAHPQWGGTALLGEDGRLLGIGSLLVQEKVEEQATQGNMFVPVDLLEPILDDLLSQGQANRPPRPWLGVYLVDSEGKLGIGGLAKGGPADQAGLRAGDLITAVAGQNVAGLADLFRKLWRLGAAGVEIPLTIVRRGATMQVRVTSGDRSGFLKKPKLH
ncbi:MAG: S1C family serine protease [Burkholderiales bacterium]